MSPISEHVLLVGCRTTRERDARGTGLDAFVLDTDGHSARRVGHVDAVNPSFLLTDPVHRVVHAVHGDRSEVSSYSVAVTGEIGHRVTCDTGGRNPVHLTYGRSRRSILVANHGTGSVTSFRVGDDGLLGEAVDQLDGMDGPHQVVVDQTSGLALVPDKRADAVHVLGIAPDAGLRVVSSCPTPSGAGPRHLVVDPDAGLVHVLDELASMISTYRWDATRPALTLLGRCSTLPDGADPSQWRAAELVWSPRGDRLFASNRSGAGDETPGGPGDDTIVEFALDGQSRLPVASRWHSSGGVRPRHFLVEESANGDIVVWVANERSDNVLGLRRDGNGGLVVESVISSGSPTCVAWLSR